MTKRRDDIKRPDRRIGARLETLAFLFDVSVQTVLNAISAGKIKPFDDVFGVKLYHVDTVERAVFHLPADGAAPATADEVDPAMEGVKRLYGDGASSQGQGARRTGRTGRARGLAA